MRNGSMVVLRCGGRQGYDSRSASYDAALSVKLPLALSAGQSLISTISNTTLPVPNFAAKIMWRSEQQCQNVLKTAAVLTCLASAPPADAFRPPYAGPRSTCTGRGASSGNASPPSLPSARSHPGTISSGYFQRP